MALGVWRNGFVEGVDGVHSDAELADKGTNQESSGAMTPSSVVRGVALLMAWRRWSMTVTLRP
jgi:hypothetical protein